MLLNLNFLVPASVFAVGLVVMLIVSYRAHRGRRKAMNRLVERLGWSAQQKLDDEPGDAYARFEAFRQGSMPSALNTIRGTLEILGQMRAVRMGDYKYLLSGSSTTSGTSRSWRRISYIIVDMPLEHVPPVRLRPLTRADRIVGVLGKKLSSGSSAKAFDRALLATRPGMKEFMKRFRVEGADDGFEHPLFTNGMIEFLLRDAPAEVDIVSTGCCLSGLGKPWKAREFESNLVWLHDFVERWPGQFRAEIESSR